MDKGSMVFTLDQFEYLARVYGLPNGVFPDPPTGYEFTGELVPANGVNLVMMDVGKASTFDGCGVMRLELEKKRKKYRFVCDNPERVQVKNGDYLLINNEFVHMDHRFDKSGLQSVVFRLEEIA